MYEQLRARVTRVNHPSTPATKPWAAQAIHSAPGVPAGVSTRTLYAHTWPEAMQLAYKLRAELDAILMYEVHESRARRRTA